jgi:hypothetical protein
MASCTIQRGYSESCKDFQGGVDKLYLFPFVKYGVSDVLFGGFSKLSNPNAQDITQFPQTIIFDYEAVNINYSESASVTSGGVEWSQDLTFTLPRSFVDLNAYKLMRQDYSAIILDRNGNYRIIGLWNGGEVTLNATTGGDKAAMNGTSVTLKARENNQAYFLNNFSIDFTVFNELSVDFFELIINTDAVGTSDFFNITTGAGTFLYDVTTDEGYSATGLTGDHLITFPTGSGVHKVSISGVFPAYSSSSGLDNDKIIEISNFGIYGLGSTSQYEAFLGCDNLIITATDSGNFGNVTNFSNAFAICNSLPSFPLIDTGKGEDFISAWEDSEVLTEFPLLDFSSGTSFDSAWQGCSILKTFPSNAFDNCTATDFANSFTGTNLNTQSIDNILISIDYAGQINGTFNQSGGQAPSSVGLAARDSLIVKGWTMVITEPDFLLLGDTGFLLQEDGSKIIL